MFTSRHRRPAGNKEGEAVYRVGSACCSCPGEAEHCNNGVCTNLRQDGNSTTLWEMKFQSETTNPETGKRKIIMRNETTNWPALCENQGP